MNTIDLLILTLFLITLFIHTYRLNKYKATIIKLNLSNKWLWENIRDLHQINGSVPK